MKGAGPIIHGPDVTSPGRFIVQVAGGILRSLDLEGVAAIPLPEQWFTLTVNGLLCTWPTREIAEHRAANVGTPVGLLRNVDGQLVVCHADGTPWDVA